MSREIKFRAWDKDNITMQYVGARHWFKLASGLLLATEANEDWELMQYTGLKSKSGVEIYEGDIIFAKMMSISPIGTYVKVVFDKGSFQVEDKKGDRCWNDYLIMINGEVIGNVWENSELLKENK